MDWYNTMYSHLIPGVPGIISGSITYLTLMKLILINIYIFISKIQKHLFATKSLISQNNFMTIFLCTSSVYLPYHCYNNHFMAL